MKLNTPYRRIVRPFLKGEYYFEGGDPNYIENMDFAPDLMETIRAYNVIEKDLVSLFDYIEPTINNFSSYSHRIYELYLRICTEFESNAKKILIENQYKKSTDLNIEDYYKINRAMRLSEYKLYLNTTSTQNRLVFTPFIEWNNNHSLSWYRDYNLVKHNRYDNFKMANLGNLLNASAGLFSIIFGQFYTFSFSKNVPLADHKFNRFTGELCAEGNIFGIITPNSWGEEEMYGFNWEELKEQGNSFQIFNF